MSLSSPLPTTRSGNASPLKIEWHPDAVADLASVATADRRRIRDVLAELRKLDDARQRLVPYVGPLKGHWKLRVGDYRLVCRLERRGEQVVLVILVAHRSVAYRPGNVRTALRRSE